MAAAGIGLLLLVLLSMASTTRAQRQAARERLKWPGRIVGAITAAVVVLIYNWERIFPR